MKRRAALWRGRVAVEYNRSCRTWLGTLTISPQNRFIAVSQARQRLRNKGVDFDTEPELAQQVAIHREIGPSLQRYLKRVRKASNAPLRYLLIGEMHKDGFPHYHVLVHELREDVPIRHRVLSEQWTEGFCNWKLVRDLSGALYAAKYLTKSEAHSYARVRASVGYGEMLSSAPA